jgi:hypothetical protein
MVLISRLTQCPFAVKGGGHAAFSGASSIDGGITVSMENLKKVQLSSDQTTADIGPGNRWVDVYTALGNSNVGVVGGRVCLQNGNDGVSLTLCRWLPLASLALFWVEASASSPTSVAGLAIM